MQNAVSLYLQYLSSRDRDTSVHTSATLATSRSTADCNGFVKEMCYVTQEPVTSDSFYDYFTIFVLPHLRPFGEKGGILVLDNVGAWATRRCVFARLCMRRARAE